MYSDGVWSGSIRISEVLTVVAKFLRLFLGLTPLIITVTLDTIVVVTIS